MGYQTSWQSKSVLKLPTVCRSSMSELQALADPVSTGSPAPHTFGAY